jgi:hypothetical protein
MRYDKTFFGDKRLGMCEIQVIGTLVFLEVFLVVIKAVISQ